MPSLHQLGLALRTARHLRPQQLAAQLAHRVRGPARNPRRRRAPGIDWLAPCNAALCPSPEGRPGATGVALVGRPPHDPTTEGWDAGANALWAYTLHYHGWLNHPEVGTELARATMLHWIDEHRHGVGWEPYPTSLRVLHWLGWLQKHGAELQAFERERILASLAAQLDHLATHVEVHIDGNHLWTNLVALTSAGLALRGRLPTHLLERFESRTVATVHDQLAGDGMHGERTPSYHCLLTEQLAVLSSFARAQRPRLADALAPALSAMLESIPAFTHPDGDVALWGDSQLDAPVTPTRLLERLGRTLPRGHADAPVSGFARRQWGPWTLLWNRGDVGLSHQVGHVHGDALAVELSLGGTRVVVDAGVGTYDIGPERAYARSTAAHNTVTVGSGVTDQHELWASHRIGARAQPRTLACADDRIVAEVRGHASPATHRRSIEHEDGVIRVTDTVDQPNVPAVVRYFVPAGLAPTLRGETVELDVAGRRVQIRAPGGRWHASEAPGWVGMGRSAPRVCLSLPLGMQGTVVEFRAFGG